MSVTLLAIALAAQPIECAPLPGWEEVAEAADGKFLIFGETHGTNEAPAALAEYVCAASETRSILVAIEFGSGSNDGFQRAWAVSHDQFAQALIKEVPEWRGREDGVASEAMFSMLVRLHALKSVGRRIDIVAFNGAKNEEQRAKFAHLPGQDSHEAAQAANIRAASEIANYEQSVVLVGGLHASKDKVFVPPAIQPMAMHLAAPDEIVSLRMVHDGGESWSCQARDYAFSCKAHAARAWSDPPEIGFHLNYSPDEAAFDGVFSLSKITASPPAVPKKD